MRKSVIDSSIIVKFLTEEGEENINQANALLSDCQENKIKIFAPELAKYELGNVLLKGKQFTPSEAYLSLGTAYSLPINFVLQTKEDAYQTYQYAYENNITYYDASFLSLAKRLDCPLITSNVKHQGKVREVEVVPLKYYPQSK